MDNLLIAIIGALGGFVIGRVTRSIRESRQKAASVRIVYSPEGATCSICGGTCGEGSRHLIAEGAACVDCVTKLVTP